MPRGNGMGPMGMGPKTGRAAGFCACDGRPEYAGAGAGRRCGAGQGPGRHGLRNRFLATGVPGWLRAGGDAGFEASGGVTERQVLTSQAEALQRQLDAVRQRLAGLDKREG